MLASWFKTHPFARWARASVLIFSSRPVTPSGKTRSPADLDRPEGAGIATRVSTALAWLSGPREARVPLLVTHAPSVGEWPLASHRFLAALRLVLFLALVCAVLGIGAVLFLRLAHPEAFHGIPGP